MKEHRPLIKFGVSTEKRILPENRTVSALPPHQWTEMTLADLPNNLILQNQGSASDCGANGPKKMINLQTKGDLIVSCHPYYSKRSNNPELGMMLDDIIKIPCTSGTCLESIDPSDGLSEEQLDAPVTVETPIVGSNPVELDVSNIEELASHCDVFRGIILTVNIAWDEWNTEQGIPIYMPEAELSGGHCLGGGIPAIYNGSKGIFMQNSWGNDDDSINETSWVFFTEEFLKYRGTGAGTFNSPIQNCVLFSRELKKGMVGSDVTQLQSLLEIKSDGIFGIKTQAEVILFQTLHELVPDGIVGPKTQAILQTLTKKQIMDYPKIDSWCKAAQTYEGWFIPGTEGYPEGSESYQNNNPGNLDFGTFAESFGAVKNGRWAKFPSYEEGYKALYTLFSNACLGKSEIYHPTMTLKDFYAIYAPSSDSNNPDAYAIWIANTLDVPVDVQICSFLIN